MLAVAAPNNYSPLNKFYNEICRNKNSWFIKNENKNKITISYAHFMCVIFTVNNLNFNGINNNPISLNIYSFLKVKLVTLITLQYSSNKWFKIRA